MKCNLKEAMVVPNSFYRDTKDWGLAEFKIYIYLASMCFGDKMVCWPSQERIAEDTGIALPTVKSNIKHLKDRGAIKIVRASEYDENADLRQRAYILTDWTNLKNLDAVKKQSHKKKVGIPNNRYPQDTNVGIPNIPNKVSQTSNKKDNIRITIKELKKEGAGEFDETDENEHQEATEAQGKQGEGVQTYEANVSERISAIKNISAVFFREGFIASESQKAKVLNDENISDAQLALASKNILKWASYVKYLNTTLKSPVDGSMTIFHNNVTKFLRWLEPEEKVLSYEEQEKININLKQSVKRLCDENGIWDQDECWKWVNDNNNVPWIENKMDHVQNLWVSRFDLIIKDGKLAFGHDILTKDQIKSLSKDNIQATVRKINGEVRK